jgi:hypothetical protein
MSHEARVLGCASCGAPTTFLAPSCGWCAAPLTWHDVPTLRRGALIRRFDLTRGELLPGMDKIPGLEVRPGDGVVVPIPAGRNLFLHSGLQRADAAVWLEATALDPGVGFGLEMRVTTPGKGRTSYALKFLPWLRAVRLDRVLSLEKDLFIEPLRAPETTAQLPAHGQPVELEARCADSILSIHAGRLHLGSFVDARYGFGAFGFTVNGYQAAGRVLVRSFAIHEVA